MKHYLRTTEDILQSSGYLTNTILCAVIQISEVNVKLIQLTGRNFVYLLCDKYEVVYIGRTKNLYTRLVHHKMDKKFTDIILLEYSQDNVSYAEKQIIKLLKPTLNKCWVHYGH